MSNEYIRKEDAINIAESYEVKRDGFYLNDYEYGRTQVASSIASDLEDIQPADVAPVVHGKWIGYDDTERFTAQCSLCGNVIDTRFGSNFCPYCGAKMDGEE